MMTIHVSEFIATAFSPEDAEKINPVISQAVADNEVVVLDFSGITFFTTYFFSSAITRFVFELGPEMYDKKFQVTGLTEVGKTAYTHSLDFAREEIELTEEQKLARLEAFASEFGEG